MKPKSLVVSIATLVIGVFSAALCGCAPGFAWGYDEHARETSPDGRFDAIVLEGNAGAMSGYQYEIYILPRGSKVDREAHRRHCVYESYENSGKFSYVWKGSDLHVTVEEVPIDHFWPYYFSEDASGKRTREGRVYLYFRRDEKK